MAKRPATGLKAKPKKIPLPRSPRMVDTKYLGLEPEWEGVDLEDNDSRLARSYGWYNHFYGLTEAKKWALEHFAKADPELGKKLSRVPESAFSTTVGWLCRMEDRGADLPPQSRTWRRSKIAEMLKSAELIKEVKDEVKVTRGSNYKAPGYHSDIEAIELMLDSFCESGYTQTFVTYDYLSKTDVKKTYAIAIADHFRPLFDELKLLATGKDKDLTEGYRKLTKKQRESYQKQVWNIIEDCERWSANKTKVSRVARTPKKKSNEQILKAFKYMKDLPELKMVSIDPSQILGAKALIAYNHKYKKLMLFLAKDGETLSVKGTSIVGFDEKTTSGKTLRKPAQQLPMFSGGSALSTAKSNYDEIKSKPSAPSGRIGTDVLLIKAFR